MSDAPPVDDGHCFACGKYSVDGMHLRFAPDGERGVRAEVILPPRFQGWRGTAHGGIVMTMLDEAMAHACGTIGERGMTAATQFRFRAPVPLGKTLILTGTVKWKRRNVIGLESAVSSAEGTLLATGEGSFVSRGPLGKAGFATPDGRPG